MPQVRGLQAQKANIAAVLQGKVQATAVNLPAGTLQAGQQTVAIVAGVDDEQATQSGSLVHDRSLAPIVGFLRENSKLRRRINSSNELDAAHDRLSAGFCQAGPVREFLLFIGVTAGAGKQKMCNRQKNLHYLCDSTPNLEHQYE
jgi:hypothetical protein